jgi:uncharacterized protein YjbI with pentapeptide repeats
MSGNCCQNIYLSFLLLGTYIAIIIGSTTDVQLLKVSPVTLPLLNVQLPIVEFYAVVPWLLWLFHFNLLLHLTFLAQKLHRFNAVLTAFTDDAAREDQRARLFPFPFSVMLIGRPAPWYLQGLLGLTVWMTIIVLPFGLLLWTQLRFLPYHHELISWTHRAAVLVDLGLLWWLWPLILIPEHREMSAALLVTQWWEEHRVAQRNARTRRLRWRIVFSCLSLMPIVFSLGLAVLPEECMEGLMASIVPKPWRHVDPTHTGKPVFLLTYWLFESPRALFHRNLWLQEQVLVAGDPSAEVVAALNSGDEHERAQGLKKITGLPLTNRDLRGANLKGADLFRARVFTSNLSSFSLSRGERCVDDAQLSENRAFCRTSFQGAVLQQTQLWEANLQNAQFQGADLQYVQMQGAILEGAQLQGAVLLIAQLQVVNLNNAHFQGATLAGAQLQGADLKNAQLQGAALSHADLRGADLQNSTIGNADFTQADLTLSNLQSLSSSPLDAKQYEQLEKILTHAINDEHLRARCLKQIKAAVGQPDHLQQALPPEKVLCDDINLFPSCLTKEKITEYAHARASFLGNLGCNDAAIARGVVRNLEQRAGVYLVKMGLSLIHSEDPMLMALAKIWVAIQAKDCPGWAALPADQKMTLRNWAGGKTLVP